MSGDDVVIAPESFGSVDARTMSAAYYRELAERFAGGYEADNGSHATPDDLEDSRGCYLVARVGGEAVGCVALRRHDRSTGELKHMWVSGPHRRRGIARRLVVAAEERAEGMGMVRIILDTRSELPEAMSLYRSAGYLEISAYNENPYADHWFEKRLSPR